jgi:hypothetical protein
MKPVDFAGIFIIGIMLGCTLGLMANGKVYYFAGKVRGYEKAQEEAKRWAEEELKAHCPGWYTDRRQHDYMACKKPEWMRK